MCVSFVGSWFSHSAKENRILNNNHVECAQCTSAAQKQQHQQRSAANDRWKKKWRKKQQNEMKRKFEKRNYIVFNIFVTCLISLYNGIKLHTKQQNPSLRIHIALSWMLVIVDIGAFRVCMKKVLEQYTTINANESIVCIGPAQHSWFCPVPRMPVRFHFTYLPHFTQSHSHIRSQENLSNNFHFFCSKQ